MERTIKADLAELKGILEAEWPARSAALAVSGVLLNESAGGAPAGVAPPEGEEQGGDGGAGGAGGAGGGGAAPEHFQRLEGRINELFDLFNDDGDGDGAGGDGGAGEPFTAEELAQLYSDPEAMQAIAGAAGLMDEDELAALAEGSGMDPNEFTEGYAALQELIGGQVQEGVQAALGPYMQQQQTERREAEFGALEETYPALADPETADPVWQEATRVAAALGQPALRLNAEFVEQVYLAHVARQDAQSEVPAGERRTILEGGGGAQPAGSDEDPAAIADRIVKAGGPQLPF